MPYQVDVTIGTTTCNVEMTNAIAKNITGLLCNWRHFLSTATTTIAIMTMVGGL